MAGKKLLNVFVNIFLVPLVLISLAGAITVLLHDVITAGRSGILLIDVSFALTVIYLLVHSRNKLPSFRISKRWRWWLIAAVIIWQGYLLVTMAGISKWDSGIILMTAVNRVPLAGLQYFSFYHNNFFLLIIEHLIWQLCGQPDIRTLTYILGILNYALLDSSLFVLYRIAQRYLNDRSARATLWLGIILLGITPWACIPYSDILAFVLSVFTMAVLLKYIFSHDLRKKCLCAGLAGLLFSFDYLLKPSTIITFIAFIIVAACWADYHSINWKSCCKTAVSLIVLVLIPTVLITGMSVYQSNNSFVKVDKHLELPMVHFAALGATGTGTFSLADQNRDEAIKSPVKRKQVASRIWKQRIKKMGFFGYQSFLIRKQVANTADGSLAWGVEGGFLTPFHKHLNSLGQRLYYADGVAKYNSALNIVIQSLWVATLLALLFTVDHLSFIGLLSKYAFVGFCFFLLIFEGGRSRYVIQFLPFILILAGIGINRICLVWQTYKKGHDNN